MRNFLIKITALHKVIKVAGYQFNYLRIMDPLMIFFILLCYSAVIDNYNFGILTIISLFLFLLSAFLPVYYFKNNSVSAYEMDLEQSWSVYSKGFIYGNFTINESEVLREKYSKFSIKMVNNKNYNIIGLLPILIFIIGIIFLIKII